jgi:hypothetical protein
MRATSVQPSTAACTAGRLPGGHALSLQFGQKLVRSVKSSFSLFSHFLGNSRFNIRQGMGSTTSPSALLPVSLR